MKNNWLIIVAFLISLSAHAQGERTDVSAFDSRSWTPDTTVTLTLPVLAVKSNLLYDVALTPNIEVERWFGHESRYSFAAEFNFPWYTWHNHSRAYEVMEVGLEYRHWYGARTSPLTPLQGAFWGAYFSGGYYDVEWGYKGNRGHFTSWGLSLGYSTALSRHWHMEFSGALGGILFVNTRYDDPQHNDRIHRLYRKHAFYVLPTKLKVALAWMIGNRRVER